MATPTLRLPCSCCGADPALAVLVDGDPVAALPTRRATKAARVRTSPFADLVVIGSITTMDPLNPTAEALAVEDGRISAIGSLDDVRDRIGPDTELVEVGEGACYPGFVEPHMHLWATGALAGFVDCSCLTHDSFDSVLDALRDAVADAEPGAWITGQQFDPSLFPGEPVLHRDLLDEIAPHNPVVVINASIHFAYVNSLALDAAGFHDGDPDPAGGTLGRDANGRLDGILGEMPAIGAALRAAPAKTPEQFLDAVVAIGEAAASVGITKVHEAATGALFGAGELKMLEGLAESGRMPVRVTAAIIDSAGSKLPDISPGDGDDLVRVVSWKVISDGSNQGRSGYMTEPYLGSDDRGQPNYEEDDLRAIVARADAAGWQVMVHANGDAAIEQVVEAFEGLGPADHDRRHRIEHCSLATDDHFRRMAAVNVSPSFLIAHVYYWGQAFRDTIIGPERAARLDGLASARRHGLRPTLHSDHSVSPMEPLREVQTAVTRGMRAGGVLNADECDTVEAALRAVTIDAAWQTHSDDSIGSLEVGKYADLVFLSADPQAVDPETIADIQVLETRLAGRTTYLNG